MSQPLLIISMFCGVRCVVLINPEFLIFSSVLSMSFFYSLTAYNFISQIHREFRKPLIVMSPKNLLRHKDCKSNLSEFDDVQGHQGFDKQGTRFKRLIKDQNDHSDLEEGIRRLVLCSGKVCGTLFIFAFNLLCQTKSKIPIWHTLKHGLKFQRIFLSFRYSEHTKILNFVENFPLAKYQWMLETFFWCHKLEVFTMLNHPN